MITVQLFTRQGCTLCEQAEADLLSLQGEYPHQVEKVDVDQDPKQGKPFAEMVPVVKVGPYTLRAPFDCQELLITLGAVQRGLEHDAMIARDRAEVIAPPANQWTSADRISYFLSKHYLALLNIVVVIYLGLPVLAPVLMHVGATTPAELIYKGYGFVCHQFAFRSWFLFGEQVAYPRAAAHIPGLVSFSQATGISDEDLIAARNFIGNSSIGYKMAFCERDAAIYFGILFFGLIYGLIKRRLPRLPWYLWIAIAIIPIGLDGVSQELSQPPFSLLPYRESTPFLRFLTGFLFGFGTAWFGYPIVEETMVQTRRIMQKKWDYLKTRGLVKA